MFLPIIPLMVEKMPQPRKTRGSRRTDKRRRRRSRGRYKKKNEKRMKEIATEWKPVCIETRRTNITNQ